ncbi:MAG: SurA N-terminal domain-containing protein [Dysgonamonadaceae bacterium]|jgi:peptidyl-prolyl cis-trans isomerase D|nr:SurA N-terminal domain-containing protein [Dysgonamonadaceae bacterium]
MATLEKIRNKAGLLVGVVGLALLAFIIGDFLKSGSTFFHQSKEKIVIVDGQSVGYQEFMKRVEDMSNAYKNNYGGALQEDQQDQIRQAVYDEVVGKILLDNESEKTGLTVGADELTDMIMGKNISPMIQQYFRNPQTGVFDRNALMQFLQIMESEDMWLNYSDVEQQQLAAQKMQWNDMKNVIVEQKKIGKLNTFLSSAMVSNVIDAKAAYEENNENVDFNFVAQPYISMPDSAVVVSESELKSLYEKRKEEFKQEEARVIDYISVAIAPSSKDIQDAIVRLDTVRSELQRTDEVSDIINDNSDVKYADVYLSTTALNESERVFVSKAGIGDVEGPVSEGGNVHYVHKLIGKKEAPDSVKLNLIVLPNFTDDVKLAAYADSLTQVVKGGKSFTQMVLELTNGQGNGDTGWQTEISLFRNGLDTKFVDAIFKSDVNKVFLHRAALRNYLVQVSEKTKPVTKYKIGTVQYLITASQETMNKIYNNLSAYITNNNKIESFKNSGENAGYLVQKEVPIYANQLKLSSLESSRSVIRWAFNSNKGSISEIIQCGDYYVVAAVEGKLKEGYRPLKEVADILKRELLNQKKGEKIVKNLEAKNLTSLEDYAREMNTEQQEVKFVTFSTPRISAIGAEPAVNVVALSTEKGKISKPFAGKTAAYVLSVTDRRTGEQPFDEKTQMQQLNMQNSYRVMSFLQNNALLKEIAKIEDNRIRFF